ncbi:MAG: AAA family ATPase [Arenicellales bacterium]|nr:AAA family ATPase [Arenicellales bacterium]
MDTEITDEFQQVLDLLSVATPPVVFVTGSAGTGKSTLIDVLRSELDKNLVVVAPTGVAALNVQGQTIHSLFQLPPGPQPRAKRIVGAAKDVVEKMDVLVIDEVSMVRADLLDAIDDSLRLNTGRDGVPFGGKTLVLVGDMHQLPPVIAGSEEKRLFEESYESPYFFSARTLRELPLVTVTLTRSFRQADAHFIEMLDHIRTGSELEQTVAQLNQAVDEEMVSEETRLVLTSVNARARQFNEQQLAQLAGESWSFDADVNGDWLDNESQLPSPTKLKLKVDAQVMFTKNGTDWVNGSLGRVVHLEEEVIEIELLGDEQLGQSVFVERESWERYRYQWDDKRRRVDTEVIGTYTQFPFILAWAVTVHKAQGLTLEHVRIDLGRGMFAPGQAYVALSRCRTLDGISFNRALSASDVKCDPLIQSFYRAIDLVADGEAA